MNEYANKLTGVLAAFMEVYGMASEQDRSGGWYVKCLCAISWSRNKLYLALERSSYRSCQSGRIKTIKYEQLITPDNETIFLWLFKWFLIKRQFRYKWMCQALMDLDWSDGLRLYIGPVVITHKALNRVVQKWYALIHIQVLDIWNQLGCSVA